MFVALLPQLYCYKRLLLSILSVSCGLVKELKPTRLTQVGMHLTSLWDVPGLNLDWDTDCDE